MAVAAFDVNNLEYYLNNIPFSDHGALLDPPTEDVTARCISMLAQLGETADTSPAVAAGIAYLRKTQLPEGSWYGRWGLNYIYGTWSVLCALNAAGVGHQDPMVRKAADWLLSVQNADGGWGEDAASYRLDYKEFDKGFDGGPTTASQTAWALLGLMAAGEVENLAVARGVECLMATQTQKACGISNAIPQRAFLGCFICAIMAIPNSSALGVGAVPEFAKDHAGW